MNFDEAIKKSEEARAFLLAYHRPGLAEAVGWATEALKKIKEIRNIIILPFLGLLPAEEETDGLLEELNQEPIEVKHGPELIG